MLWRITRRRSEVTLNSQVVHEFKESRFNSLLNSQVGSTVVWESSRLTTAYSDPTKPKGSDRIICGTVNGVLQVKLLDKSLLAEKTGITVTAGLWGEYNGVPGVLQSLRYSLDGQYANDLIIPVFLYPNPILQGRGYGVPIFESNGGLGFTSFQSFSNNAQNIYLRVAFVREIAQEVEPPPVMVDIVCSGVLIAADPR